MRILVRQRIRLWLSTAHVIVAARRTGHSFVDWQLLLSGRLLSRVNQPGTVRDDVTVLALIVRDANATGQGELKGGISAVESTVFNGLNGYNRQKF